METESVAGLDHAIDLLAWRGPFIACLLYLAVEDFRSFYLPPLVNLIFCAATLASAVLGLPWMPPWTDALLGAGLSVAPLLLADWWHRWRHHGKPGFGSQDSWLFISCGALIGPDILLHALLPTILLISMHMLLLRSRIAPIGGYYALCTITAMVWPLRHAIPAIN